MYILYQKPQLKSMAHAVHPRITAQCVVATQRERSIALKTLGIFKKGHTEAYKNKFLSSS